MHIPNPNTGFKKASLYLYHKLFPLLRNVSLDYKINLWQVLIRPLFDMLLGHFQVECVSNREKVLVLMRKSFKKFTLLKKNVGNDVVMTLVGNDFSERVQYVCDVARKRWATRKSRSTSSEAKGEVKLVDTWLMPNACSIPPIFPQKTSPKITPKYFFIFTDFPKKALH